MEVCSVNTVSSTDENEGHLVIADEERPITNVHFTAKENTSSGEMLPLTGIGHTSFLAEILPTSSYNSNSNGLTMSTNNMLSHSSIATNSILNMTTMETDVLNRVRQFDSENLNTQRPGRPFSTPPKLLQNSFMADEPPISFAPAKRPLTSCKTDHGDNLSTQPHKQVNHECDTSRVDYISEPLKLPHTSMNCTMPTVTTLSSSATGPVLPPISILASIGSNPITINTSSSCSEISIEAPPKEKPISSTGKRSSSKLSSTKINQEKWENLFSAATKRSTAPSQSSQEPMKDTISELIDDVLSQTPSTMGQPKSQMDVDNETKPTSSSVPLAYVPMTASSSATFIDPSATFSQPPTIQSGSGPNAGRQNLPPIVQLTAMVNSETSSTTILPASVPAMSNSMTHAAMSNGLTQLRPQLLLPSGPIVNQNPIMTQMSSRAQFRPIAPHTHSSTNLSVTSSTSVPWNSSTSLSSSSHMSSPPTSTKMAASSTATSSYYNQPPIAPGSRTNPPTPSYKMPSTVFGLRRTIPTPGTPTYVPPAASSPIGNFRSLTSSTSVMPSNSICPASTGKLCMPTAVVPPWASTTASHSGVSHSASSSHMSHLGKVGIRQRIVSQPHPTPQSVSHTTSTDMSSTGVCASRHIMTPLPSDSQQSVGAVPTPAPYPIVVTSPPPISPMPALVPSFSLFLSSQFPPSNSFTMTEVARHVNGINSSTSGNSTLTSQSSNYIAATSSFLTGTSAPTISSGTSFGMTPATPALPSFVEQIKDDIPLTTYPSIAVPPGMGSFNPYVGNVPISTTSIFPGTSLCAPPSPYYPLTTTSMAVPSTSAKLPLPPSKESRSSSVRTKRPRRKKTDIPPIISQPMSVIPFILPSMTTAATCDSSESSSSLTSQFMSHNMYSNEQTHVINYSVSKDPINYCTTDIADPPTIVCKTSPIRMSQPMSTSNSVHQYSEVPDATFTQKSSTSPSVDVNGNMEIIVEEEKPTKESNYTPIRKEEVLSKSSSFLSQLSIPHHELRDLLRAEREQTLQDGIPRTVRSHILGGQTIYESNKPFPAVNGRELVMALLGKVNLEDVDDPMDITEPCKIESPRPSPHSSDASRINVCNLDPSGNESSRTSVHSEVHKLHLPYPSEKALHLWSVEEVFRFVASIPGLGENAAMPFKTNEIDGEALSLLEQGNLLESPLSMKVGPAVKLYAHMQNVIARDRKNNHPQCVSQLPLRCSDLPGFSLSSEMLSHHAPPTL